MFENFSIISLAPSDKTYIQITGPSVMLEEILIKSLEPSYVVFKPSNILKIYIPITEPSVMLENLSMISLAPAISANQSS